MSFEFHYFFRSQASLDDVAHDLNDALSTNFRPLEDNPTVYQSRILATGFCLTHNFMNEDDHELNDYPFILSAKVWAPENDLLYVLPSLFFSTIYLMYKRLKIESGVWAGDSFEPIAKYDYIKGRQGWHWYDTTNDCIAGCENEHVDDYLNRIFANCKRGGKQ